MQIESLMVFCDVVRHASFSRAAAQHSISQSSASQAVMNLEERLGVRLIDRSKRPLSPTREGQVFYEGCRDLIGRYEQLISRVTEPGHRAAMAGPVRIAAIYSVGLSHLTRFIEEFRGRHGAVDCRLDCMHPDEVVQAVRAGRVDVGVVSFPRKWADLTVEPWREEAMVLVLPPGHEWAAEAAVPTRRLDGAKFVHFDAGLAIRRAIDRSLKARGATVDTVLHFDNVENIKRAVEVGAGTAILPEPSVAREAAGGSLVTRPLADLELRRPLALVHRGRSSLSQAAARFVGELTAFEAGQGARLAPAAASA